MFESSLLAALTADSTLCSYVSTYCNAPAIFSDFAPESADMPYLTFNIRRSFDDSPAIQRFTVFVDYYEYQQSAANCRKAAERIEFILDRIELDHERYSKIRLFFFAGSMIEESDPRAIHYNLQFSGRAGRKKWIDQLDTGLTTTTSTTTTTTTTTTTAAI